jgi:membrane protein
MDSIRFHWATARRAMGEWINDRVLLLSAALAYFTVFSLAPLLLIAIAVSGLVLGEEASRGEVFRAIDGLLGPRGAAAVQAMVKGASEERSGGWLSVILGVLTLLIGAGGVFGQLQEALNLIFRVQARPGRGLWSFIRQRFLSFAMVAGTAFLLLVSMLVTAALASVARYLSGILPGSVAVWEAINLLVSLGVIASLFAMIFKILPDVRLSWRDVWPGAILTAVLFLIGKVLIGLYLGKSSVASAYGAAGSLVTVLVWVFYSGAILFFGAELVKAGVLIRKGRLPEPKKGAEFAGTNVVQHPTRRPASA